MFNPKYTITNKLLANIKRIGELVVELNNRNFSYLVLVNMERRAREISVYSSTSIEGNPLPLTDVKEILKNKPENIRESEKEVLNYNKALIDLNFLIKDLADKNILNIDLILKTQETITFGLIEKYRSGRIRKEPVFVNNPKNREVVYLPPDHQDVHDLLKDLFSYLDKNKNKIDPLILAGIFHKQFVVIHPFVDGNGRTARLLTKVLLAQMKLNTFNLFSFENYYNKNISRYFEKVGVFGNYYEINDKIDFTLWLEYFTEGIIDELLRVIKELEEENKIPENRLKEHHKKIITFIKKWGYITDRDYADVTDRARATRNMDFRKLISNGIIQKFGNGKATYYKLK